MKTNCRITQFSRVKSVYKLFELSLSLLLYVFRLIILTKHKTRLSINMTSIDIDQRLEELQREYVDFLDDMVYNLNILYLYIMSIE